MQPYFLPYMGYWQLIAHVDEFILYDDIQYTKKGWITRNRFLLNGADSLFSLSVRADSDFLPVYQRVLAESFDRQKLVRQLREAYRKAPHYADHFPLIEDIILCPEDNLFSYIQSSIVKLCDFLSIKTPIVVSSGIDIPKELKAQDKVIALCQAREGTDYINPIGGLELYDRAAFLQAKIALSFLRSKPLNYPQFSGDFLPHLSILDVLMFNSRDRICGYLDAFSLE